MTPKTIGPITANIPLVAEAWLELLRAMVRVRVSAGRARWLSEALCLPPSPRSQGTGVRSQQAGANSSLTPERGWAAKTSEVLEASAVCSAAVDRAGRYHLGPMRCLNRSLALLWMLRRRGIATALRLGCRRQGEAHDFHAWVVDGEAKPLVDSPEQAAFVPLQPPNP